MSTVLWILVLAGLAVATALATAHGGGYVLLVLPPWRIELSVAASVAGLMALMVLGFFLTRLTAGTLSLPATIRALRLGRRRARAREAVLQAVMAYFDGRYARAEQAAAQALQQGESAALCAVVAARAAHAQRRFETRDGYLDAMQSSVPVDRVLQLTTRADLLLDERRHQEALDVLRQASQAAPRNQTVRRLTLRAQTALHQWDKALQTLEGLERSRGIDTAHAQALRHQAQLELLARHGHDAESLRDYWKTFDPSSRLDRTLAVAAARRFIALRLMDDARAVIEPALEHSWDGELAELYGQCPSGNVLAQIEQAESWLLRHSSDAGLLLSLGRLCLHQSLWGKARNYLEASLALEPTADARALLGQLLARSDRRQGESAGNRPAADSPDSSAARLRYRPLPPDLEGG